MVKSLLCISPGGGIVRKSYWLTMVDNEFGHSCPDDSRYFTTGPDAYDNRLSASFAALLVLLRGLRWHVARVQSTGVVMTYAYRSCKIDVGIRVCLFAHLVRHGDDALEARDSYRMRSSNLLDTVHSLLFAGDESDVKCTYSSKLSGFATVRRSSCGLPATTSRTASSILLPFTV